jgi:hypothetical protein
MTTLPQSVQDLAVAGGKRDREASRPPHRGMVQDCVDEPSPGVDGQVPRFDVQLRVENLMLVGVDRGSGHQLAGLFDGNVLWMASHENISRCGLLYGG